MNPLTRDPINFAASECRRTAADFAALERNVAGLDEPDPEAAPSQYDTARYDIPPIPEYHDCQKLIIDSNYGPTVGIYHVRDNDPDAEWRLAAIVENTTRDTAYAPLGIAARRQHCLWIDAADQAALLLSCGDPPDPSQAERQLSVTVDQHTAGGRLPDVARWGFYEGRYHIELRCRSGWCAVAESPMQSADNTVRYFPDGGSDKRRMPGWYDQQVLAVQGADQLLPRGPLATIIPVDGLEQYDEAAFLNTLVHVGTVYIQGEPGIYANKYGFDGTPGAYTEVWLTHEPETGANADPDKGWLAVLITKQADGTETGKLQRKVVRESHPREDVPGTARWAWFNEDEQGWWRCGAACCSVSGDE